MLDPALECWFLTGPTASGKTEVGVALAQCLGAEIVSMDSMALYRGMDVGTAKPSAEQRLAVPHHLIDVLEPHEEFSLAQYLEAAHRLIREIRSRGREPLFVGGTPLYLKALLRGAFRGPPADWALRQRLEAQAHQHPPGYLHQVLSQIDPVAAARLHPNDTRRLIRAIEVYQQTGRPISALQTQFAQGRPASACRVFVLHWPRADLHARIDARVEAMFARRLVDEVRALLQRPAPLSRTARQALGYREVIQYLAGRLALDQTIRLVKTHTRQFAKRQATWFRSLSECRFVEMQGDHSPDRVAEAIRQAGSR